MKDLANTRWTGGAELWIDKLNNDAKLSDCAIEIGDKGLTYTWSYEGKQHTGSITPTATGADFTDTFHSAKPMACTTIPGSWAMLDVLGSFSFGDSPPWGWRITVSRRPDA